MLVEIFCDKFKQKTVSFHQGLNTVLGTNSGSNSIGKSSFLMIVDFAFGGSDYAKSTDIIRNVGAHEVGFSFAFGGQQYWFVRSIADAGDVWECDSSYNKLERISIEHYRDFLAEKYALVLPELTFRDAVGRYIRVYGKENLNEKQPLHAVANENAKKAIYALVKLFNCYTPISHLREAYELSAEKLKTYKKAQKYNLIECVKSAQVKKNNAQIQQIQAEIDSLSSGLEQGFLDLDATLSEEAIRLKEELSRARRKRGRIKSSLQKVEANINNIFSSSSSDFAQLLEYFPNTNVAAISEIEGFHTQLSSILREELYAEMKNLRQQLKDIESVIEEYTANLRDLIKNPNLSKTVLTKYSSLQHELYKFKKENAEFYRLNKLKDAYDEAQEALGIMEREQLAKISSDVCIKMSELNDFIYDGQYKAPVLALNQRNYTFFTPDDTGTGIAYKGMVVYDLAILSLTQLPILVHDSVVLKQISDDAIERILQLYKSIGKQIIISLDKQSSYTDAASTILESSCVLKLEANGNELFGRSWGKLSTEVLK